jgi:hypothetical protein
VPRSPQSLEQFAATNPTGGSKKGACCRLVPPEMMEQIKAERAKASPRSFGFIVKWLRSEGIDGVNEGALNNHIASEHD